jgi:hypothetical protein
MVEREGDVQHHPVDDHARDEIWLYGFWSAFRGRASERANFVRKIFEAALA